MHVLHAHEGATQEITSNRIFTGGQVWRRGLAGADTGAGREFSLGIVQFAAGARTQFHTHSGEQVLYVVHGIGKVGTRAGETVISVGDCAVIPAGEEHWHGAADTGSPMAHLALTRAESTTTVIEN